MLSVSAIREHLGGAWAVMLGRAEGLARMDLSLEGFWRSFGAILFLLPAPALAYFSQRELVMAAGEAAEAMDAGGIGVETAALLADWILFPLVFALVARALGLGPRYVAFIVVRNWASVLIGAMVGAVHAAHLVGLLPAGLTSFLLIVALALALRFSYVIARTTLGVSAGMALPIVALDLLISLTVWSAGDSLAQA